MGAVEVSTNTEDARGAGERDDIVAHLVRREIANARNEPGLVVDKQEDGALRREALVGAAPAALGLVYRLSIAHSVLLLQKSLLACMRLKPHNARVERRPTSEARRAPQASEARLRPSVRSNAGLYGASLIWKNPMFIESLHELLRLQAPFHISVCSFD
jgi:hypothetical protein